MKNFAFFGAAMALLAGSAVAQSNTEAYTSAEKAQVLAAFLSDQEPKETHVEALTDDRLAAMRAAYDEVLSGDPARVVIAQR